MSIDTITPAHKAISKARKRAAPKKPSTGRPVGRPKTKTTAAGVVMPAAPKPAGYVFGRPTKYDPAHCLTVLDLGDRGWSTVQMASHFGVGRTTIADWRKAYPAFEEAMSIAFDKAQAYWETVGQIGAQTKTVDATIWGKIMQQRFKEDWKEVKAVEHSGQIDTGRTSVVEDILALVAKGRVKDLV